MKIRIKCNGGYMSVAELAQMCGGRIVGGDQQNYNDRSICGVCTDSREAETGVMFAAIVGERTDGHDYIESADRKSVV